MNPAALGPHHRVECLDLHAHLYRVTLTLQTPEETVALSLPVWIPGSYMVREFSQHVQCMRASTESPSTPAAVLTVTQTHKNRWLISGIGPAARNTQGMATVVVVHEVYAFDPSVRTAWLDQQRGFFNGTSLLLCVDAQASAPHRLSITPPDAQRFLLPAPWQCATALEPVQTDPNGFGTYCAPNYAALVDEPVEMGLFWSGSFHVRGVPHRLVVSGAPPGFDAQRLLADTQRICETEVAFWHGPDAQPPFNRYVFMLNATHDGYGGLEHAHSTALICPRNDLPLRPASAEAPAPLKATDGYTSLLGLVAHEYFHTWNVKRLRPAELAQPDLGTENLTALLWWFEGFTSYFDDLLLLRAGLIDTPTYLDLLAKALQQVAQTPGRHIHSVAQASTEAWTKYYRVQENTPNATVSYYTKGALVALCLDLTLRQKGSSLDHAMRAAWAHSQGGPIDEAALRGVLAQLAATRLDAELEAWVHSTADLPVLDLLRRAGAQVQLEPAPLAQQLGLRVQEAQGIAVRNVLRGGLAEQAGMAAGDEWLAVEVPPVHSPSAAAEGGHTVWRLHKLDDLPPLLREPQLVRAWISRDRRIHALPLAWPGHPPAKPDDQTFWSGRATVRLVPSTSQTPEADCWPLATSR